MKDRLKELYENGKKGIEPSITEKGLLNAVHNNIISIEEMVEIVGADNELETVRAAKISEISKACGATIVAGINLEIQDRTDHFNLSIEDQSNINNLFRVVELGGTEYPYQADDGRCTVYSASEIINIYLSAQRHITLQTAYHNGLKAYVQGLESVEDISAVVYGMDLPEPYKGKLETDLTVAEQQMNAIIARLTSASES